MSDLPEPLTTPEMDVRDLDGFMLNVERLTASELVALSCGDAFKMAVMLWCRAWKQIPAGSLPNDDKVLASFSGQPQKWKKHRDMAMRGFVLCSDNRWYHTTLCEDVKRAWKKKGDFKAEREGDLQRKQREREERQRMFEQLRAVNVTPPWNVTTRELRALVTQHVTQTVTQAVTVPVTPPVTRTVTAIQGQGQGQGQKKENVIPLAPGGAAKPKSENRFPEFWKVYTRKTAKLAAEKAFERALKKADADTIIAGAKAYADRVKDVEERFIKVPTTWLNGGCWMDENLETEQTESPERLAWRNRLEAYTKKNGVWPLSAGDPPDHPNCGAPLDLLIEFGFRKGAA
jgi:uncharacterized protein YdaU (DUF1376 family)